MLRHAQRQWSSDYLEADTVHRGPHLEPEVAFWPAQFDLTTKGKMGMEPHEALNEMIVQQRRMDNAARVNANSMAELLEPHLKRVAHSQLIRLKKALAKFNMQTGRWND